MVRILSDARPRQRRDTKAGMPVRARRRRRALWIAAILTAAVVGALMLAGASQGSGGYPSRENVRKQALRLIDQVLAAAGTSASPPVSWFDSVCGSGDRAHGELRATALTDPLDTSKAATALAAAESMWRSDGFAVTAGHFETDPAYASAPDD